MRTTGVILTVGLCLGAMAIGLRGTALGAEGQELRWRFKKGDVLHIAKSKEDVSHFHVGEVQTQRITVGSAHTWLVEQVEADGSARIRHTVDRILYTSHGPLVDVSYDSSGKVPDEGPSERFARDFQRYIGRSFTFTLTPLGEVREIVASEAMRQAFEGTPPGIASLVRPDALAGFVPTILLPEQPVSRGATWKGLSNNQGANLSSTYRDLGPVEQAGKPAEKIEVETTTQSLRAEDPPQPIRSQGSKGRGTILFDAAAGRLVRADTRGTSRTIYEINGHSADVESEYTEVIEVSR